MKQSIIQRTFIIRHENKDYYIDYLNSDGQILGLINRNNWEVFDENSEELQITEFQKDTKKRKEEINKNRRLFEKLINFCVKHFEDYNPVRKATNLKLKQKKEK